MMYRRYEVMLKMLWEHVYMLSHFSHFRLFATLWTIALQAPPSMGFSRQEYWSGLPCPPPGDLPDPGITPGSLLSPVLEGRFFTTSTTGKFHGNTLVQMFVCSGYHNETPQTECLKMEICFYIFLTD